MALCEVVDTVRIELNRDLQHEVNLTLAENLVLCQVAMAPDKRLRMVDIADLLTISKSAVTKTVDHLEQRSLLVRSRHLNDRRIIYAELTVEGAKMFEASQPVFLTSVESHFGCALSEAELGLLCNFSDRLLHGA